MIGRHIRNAGIRFIETALTKQGLALSPAPGLPAVPRLAGPSQPNKTPTASAAVPKVVSTPPVT